MNYTILLMMMTLYYNRKTEVKKVKNKSITNNKFLLAYYQN